MVVVMALFYNLDMFSFSKVEEIRTLVLSFGIYAPLVFIVLFALAPLVFFPDGILALAGGLIFGFYMGSLYILLGALCGGTLSFYIARVYGKWLHKKLAHEKWVSFNKNIKKHGFITIFLLRLVPLVPFNIISYSAGFSHIAYRDFFFATLLGMIPGVLIYANIGAHALAFGSVQFYLSIAFLGGLVVVSMVLQKWIKKRLERYISKPF